MDPMAVETSHGPDTDWDDILDELMSDPTLPGKPQKRDHTDDAFIGMLAQILELEDKVKRLEKKLAEYKAKKTDYYNLDDGSPFK